MPPTDHHQQSSSSSTEEVDISLIPASVSCVTFKGIDRTKDDLLIEMAKKILLPAKTFGDVIFGSQRIKDHLENSLNGSFVSRATAVIIDSDSSNNGYNVSFVLKESSVINGSIQTVVSGSSSASTEATPSIVVSGKVTNSLGRTEQFSVEAKKSPKDSRDGSGFLISLSKPIYSMNIFGEQAPPTSSSTFKPLPLVSISAFDSSSEFSFAGIKSKEKGLSLELKSFPKGLSLISRLRFEGLNKTTQCLVPESTAFLTPSLGDFSRFSVKHGLDFEGRTFFKSSNFPVKGFQSSLLTEFTKVLGNQSFVKNELYLQGNFPLFGSRRRVKQMNPLILFQSTFRAGIISEVSRDSWRPLFVNDKFFVGGPLNVRGFALFGVGPRQTIGSSDSSSSATSSFAVGSKMFWSSGLHAYLPLPFVSSSSSNHSSLASLIHRTTRLHFYGNAASVSDSYSLKSLFKTSQQKPGLLQSQQTSSVIRTSIGSGIVIQATPFLRFEVNYSIPLRHASDDVIDPGWSFGFGVNYN